jgi:GT2 family glycosyltransferase
MSIVSVIVVTFFPNKNDLRSLFIRVSNDAKSIGIIVDFIIWDNTPRQKHLNDIVRAEDFVEFDVTVQSDGVNYGFGVGVNKVLLRSASQLAFVVNQDATIFPGAFAKAISEEKTSPPDVAIFEFRQFPNEHPKAYNPVTLITEWAAGAAFLVRVKAFKSVGGFDERMFMYSEDVDLSYRLRVAGYSIIYLPFCVVAHSSFVRDGQQKPVQALYDRANNILLRARYGTVFDIVCGLLWYALELPFRLKGSNRLYLIKTANLILTNFYYFRVSGSLYRRKLHVSFNRWKYGYYRFGARFSSIACIGQPLVSIIIRTNGRIGFLKEAFSTVANQSYENIEIIVVDDGDGGAYRIISSLNSRGKKVVNVFTGGAKGRAKAGNVGLSNASGIYVGFLDDDDQLYCDHVETLISSLHGTSNRLVFGVAEEVQTNILDPVQGNYLETKKNVRYPGAKFSRVLLWYKNYIPIQAVLFERSLFTDLGGFDESLDLYEDWSLWVKYSMVSDFCAIPKVTSRYRVPASASERKCRERGFIESYKDVQKKQSQKYLCISVEEFRLMVLEYLRVRGVFVITKDSVSDFYKKILGFLDDFWHSVVK